MPQLAACVVTVDDFESHLVTRRAFLAGVRQFTVNQMADIFSRRKRTEFVGGFGGIPKVVDVIATATG